MAHYEPSHLNLHCLQKYLSWSTGLNGLRGLKVDFPPFFYKGDNFYDFLFALMHIISLFRGDLQSTLVISKSKGFS